ncbi:hypothetical protein [Pseudonocardia alni]|uniref:hypothetical protein n=1 Tax=Pseudonocardia alni TaxID=33907 RepID=UPI00280BBA43|nr:hypothetical protein [Pseudonocardia alni]
MAGPLRRAPACRRDTAPSAQVLIALARVRPLDAAAAAHLHGLVRPGEPDTPVPVGMIIST